jgi:hypothetical protein
MASLSVNKLRRVKYKGTHDEFLELPTGLDNGGVRNTIIRMPFWGRTWREQIYHRNVWEEGKPFIR